MSSLLDSMKNGLIVSVQAYPGEPMRNPETMAQIAKAAELGGACAIRAQGLSDISAIKSRVKIPLIGLWKEGDEGVYITPTLRHAKACVSAGSDIVAVDATTRPRPGNHTYPQIVKALHEEGVLVMADCGCLADAQMALDAGSDIISTTLAGYTGSRPKTTGPDLEFVHEVVELSKNTPVFCEGRIHTPAQLREVMDCGVWAAVVGTAITHPTSITSWFVDALR